MPSVFDRVAKLFCWLVLLMQLVGVCACSRLETGRFANVGVTAHSTFADHLSHDDGGASNGSGTCVAETAATLAHVGESHPIGAPDCGETCGCTESKAATAAAAGCNIALGDLAAFSLVEQSLTPLRWLCGQAPVCDTREPSQPGRATSLPLVI